MLRAGQHQLAGTNSQARGSIPLAAARGRQGAQQPGEQRGGGRAAGMRCRAAMCLPGSRPSECKLALPAQLRAGEGGGGCKG